MLFQNIPQTMSREFVHSCISEAFSQEMLPWCLRCEWYPLVTWSYLPRMVSLRFYSFLQMQLRPHPGEAAVPQAMRGHALLKVRVGSPSSTDVRDCSLGVFPAKICLLTSDDYTRVWGKEIHRSLEDSSP